MVFDNYAKYYNLLYKDKDYKVEADHVQSLIAKFGGKAAKTLLDIGCGTGMHAYHMAQLGYQVTGLDNAQEMINQALAKKIPDADFEVGNATSFSLGKKFDIVTSLFHVLSYQTTTQNALDMIKNASAHLNENGLFIFDFWYGPAVLTEKPSVKVKRLEDDEIHVTRIAEPVLKVNENVVDVNFELSIYDKQEDRYSIVKEIHPMRYFFKPEIELLLGHAELTPLYFNEWMTGNTPSAHTWGVCCIAVRNENN
jgi:SAM-dependent methyltransferase